MSDTVEVRVRGFHADLVALRHDFHEHPELAFQEHRTSAIVAKELQNLGAQVTTGVAGTGVVATLRNGTGNRAIAIRADMDALPISETTSLPYKSRSDGLMHACGHDGHTTMLLGLARYLAAYPEFNGTVHLIFQPAEEDISGAKRMVDEGIFDRFPVNAVFGLHNMPGTPLGQVLLRPGAITAAADVIDVTIHGVAGHGALPHLATDPVVAAASIVMALQTLVSRNADALEPAVLTIGAIHGGTLATAIPETVTMKIGIRTTSKSMQDLMAKRVPEVIHAQAQSFGCTATLDYGDCVVYPVGINDAEMTALVRETALSIGQQPSDVDLKGPIMFSEDFAYMLEKVPGCFFGIGNGPSKGLHDPGYDFNDELLLKGTAFWARLVARALPA